MAVSYLQIYHNLSVALALSVVNGYSSGFQFFITTGKTAMNISTLVCGFAYASVPLGQGSAAC